MENIVVSEGLVVFFTVLLGFIFNQVAALLGLKLSSGVKKGVVFVVATVLSAAALLEAGVELPDPLLDPMNFAVVLLSLATLNFKIAQPVYDRLWKALIKA